MHIVSTRWYRDEQDEQTFKFTALLMTFMLVTLIATYVGHCLCLKFFCRYTQYI